MLRSYLKIAWRSLLRNKSFSVINIFGLALGIACSLLIMLWIQDEKSVDAFHANGDYLYQVYERQHFDGKTEAGYPTQGLLADELKKQLPEIQYASSMDYAAAPGTSNTFEAGEKISKREGAYAGADFFSMFSYPLLTGQPTTALRDANAIAISRRMAEYFFGSVDKATSRLIRFDNKETLQVTAVFENVPVNSSQQFDFLRSWAAYVRDNGWVNNWGNTSPATFIQLRKKADPAHVQAKIKDFLYRYKQKDPSMQEELDMQSYKQRYLYSTFRDGYIVDGRISYVRLFTIIALFIVLIACINFMNLATAQSARRAREVGVRKAVGADRSFLVGQFIGEAMLLVFFAIIVGVFFVAMLLPAFNSLTGKKLSLPVQQSSFWMLLTGLLLVTSLVAGSYPALFMSSLKPVRVLKGNLKFSWSAVFFRKGLVVFQFAISFVLIVATIVIYKQVNYIQAKNIGYDRYDLLYIPVEGDLVKKYGVFKEKATAIRGVASISKMRNSPTKIEHHTGSISWPGKDPNTAISFADGVVGYDFVKTMNLQLREGRDFSKDFGTDSTGYLLNETAVGRIGYKDPVGQTVVWGNHPGKVIGVIKDFHFSSLHEAIEPLIVRLDENWGWGTILVRVKAGETNRAIEGLQKLCKELNPQFPFTYQFSDEEFAKLYLSEQLVSRLSGYFAFLAIFISCLGLFGLSAFMVTQRLKEIGVRKVLGASVPSITAMLSGDFLKLVALAILVALPVAWWMMRQWLSDFAYKAAIDGYIFLLAGLITIVIALLTVSFQSIRAAVINPVKTLHSE